MTLATQSLHFTKQHEEFLQFPEKEHMAERCFINAAGYREVFFQVAGEILISHIFICSLVFICASA